MYTILGADGKEYGPVTAGKIHEWIIDGRADLNTQARRAGETAWRPLGEFPDFNQAGLRSKDPSAVPAAPPAIPPAPSVVAAAYAAAPRADLTPASRWLRLPAAMIDGLLKALCYFPVSLPVARFIFTELESGEQRPFQELSVMLNQIIAESLPHAIPYLGALALIQLVLITRRGQSIGKLLLGLRIVRTDGSPAGFPRGFFLRSTVPLVIEQIPILGFLFWIVDSAFIFRPDRRCLHDLLADTIVIKT